MRNNPRCVVLLRGPDAGVPQQLLNQPYVLAVLQQPAGEGVAEPMDGRGHFGQLAEAADGTPEVLPHRLGFADATPEEVIRMLAWQPAAFVGDLIWQPYLERNAGLFEAQGQVAALIERVAAKRRDVRPAQPTVKQQQQGAPGPIAEVRCRGWVIGREPVAGTEQSRHLILCVRHRRGCVHLRRLDSDSRIFADHLTPYGPGQKETDVLQFLPLRAGLHLAASAPGLQGFDVELRQPEVWQRSQGPLVRADCRRADVTGLTTGDVDRGGRLGGSE